MIKINKKISVWAFLVVGIFLTSIFISAASFTNPQFSVPGGPSSSFLKSQGVNIAPIFNENMCGKGQDFIVQVAPFGCSPTIVRSDLLEEQNVPVFCKLSATKINPLIDVDAIKSMSFKGQYPKEVSGIGFHPAQAAIKSSGTTLLNSPILNNIGYAVIVLKQQEKESEMPDYVEGNLTALIKYDIENAFGIGKATYYLPNLDNNKWGEKYKQYGFWNGRGFLRAEDIDNDNAIISVYSSKDNKVSTLNLKKGQTSNEIFLPGFYCMANLKVRLDGLENPDTRAKFDINGEIAEVGDDEKFLENACIVRDIKKQGINQNVQVQCRTDTGVERLDFKIVPKIMLDIDGKEKIVSVGDKLSFSDDKNKKVYLGFAGTVGNSNEEKDLYVRFTQTPYSGERLTDDMISEIARYDGGTLTGSVLAKIGKAIGRITIKGGERLSRYFIVGTEISNTLGFNEKNNFYGANIEIIGFDEPNDKVYGTPKGDCIVDGKFAPSACKNGDSIMIKEDDSYKTIKKYKGHDKWLTEIEDDDDDDPFEKYYYDSEIKDFVINREIEGITVSGETYPSFRKYLIKVPRELSDEEKELKANYTNAIKDYKTIINSYPNDKDPNSQLTFGEEALLHAIQLAGGAQQLKTMKELCKEFEERYPKSNNFPVKCNNVLKIVNSEISTRSIFVNGNVKTVSFEGIYEPTPKEYGAEITISNAEEKYSGAFILRKNGKTYFSQTEFIELKDLKENYALFDVSSVDEGKLKNVAWKTNYLKIDLSNSKVVGEKSYEIRLNKINLQKQAKVSVIPRVENAGTEANISFKIGIEKRGIQLSPDEIKDRLQTLDKSIEKWEDTSETLGEVVTGFNAACLTTGAALTIKNFFGNLNGESIARNNVMTGEGGWTDVCKSKVSKGEYGSLNQCFLDNSNAIEEAVENRAKAMQGVSINKDNCGTEATTLVNKFGSSVINDPRVKEGATPKTVDISDSMKTAFSTKGCEEGHVSFSKVRDLKTIENELTSTPDEVRKRALEIERYKILKGIDENVKGLAALEEAKKRADENGLIGINFVPPNSPKLINYGTANYYGLKASKDIGSEIKSGNSIQGVYHEDGKQYYVKLKDIGNKKYAIDDGGEAVYNLDGTKVDKDKAKEILKAYPSFELRDAKSYNNPFKNPEIRYFEVEPYKGKPAIVPFDTKKGWYAAMKQTLPGGGNIRTYDESGQITSFYLCNVGQNGKAEFDASNLGTGDDICRQFNPGTSQAIGTFPGLESGETNKRVSQAINAINEASRQYKQGVTCVKISGVNNCVKVGKPAVNIPEFQCQNFMSPKECLLLFNACDPVVCPSSRCNLGGNYHVADVVQSGIVGSTLMCLPNFKEGIVVPVCLSGVKAGLDSLISVQKNYRDCLQENLDTGKTIGICDEIHSIYMCEFFWSQAAPFAEIAIPKLFEFFTGQSGSRGGGEYASVQSSYKNAKDSMNYLTQYYGANSFKAFNAKATEGIGQTVCKNFVSARYPNDVGFDSLIKPRSPPQFSAWFSEKSFTTATVPATSQYKVFYHIYAGENNVENVGAYYSVYLKSPEGTSFFQTNPTVTVANGYIAKGDYASETKDFTAPTGYKELCIRVNAQEECGFKQVTTEFAINYLNDKYIQEQASNKNIKTESDCVSGTPSAYSLLNPNLQAGATEFANPEIYERGITRVCSTENPGKGTDPSAGTVNGKWQEVGSCDGGLGKVKCYLDKESVKNVIKNLDIENEALEAATGITKEKLKEEESATDKKIEEIEKLSAEGKIKAITDDLIKKAIFTYQKAKLHLIRGDAYAELAKPLIDKLIPRIKDSAKSITEVARGVDDIVKNAEPIIDKTPGVEAAGVSELLKGRYKSEKLSKIRTFFNFYSEEEHVPKGWTKNEFKALLVAIAQQESSLAYPNGMTTFNDDWLMGYDSDNLNSNFKGARNQIVGASNLLKRVLNEEKKDNSESNYPIVYEKCDNIFEKNEKVKCVLGVYNSVDKIYVEQVFGFWENWKAYFTSDVDGI